LNNINQPPVFMQKREPGDIINATLVFLRSEYKPLLKLTAIYVLPFMVLFAATQVFLQIKLTEAAEVITELEPERLVQELGGLYGNFLIIIFFNVFVQSLFVALVYSYVQLYLEKGKGNFSEAEVSNLLFPNSLKAITAGFAVTIISLIGLIFCILPGIVIANSLSLAVFISIYENKGLGDSLTRSWALIKNQWWITLSLNIIGILVVWLISITVTLPAVFYDYFGGTGTTVSDEVAQIPQWRWWLSGLSVLVSAVAAIIPFMFLVFQYFNLTEREKEEIL
jgi:hypothetical protein